MTTLHHEIVGPTQPLIAQEIEVRDVSVYKVLAGQGATLTQYNDACIAFNDQTPGSLEQQEWRAIHTQFKREHVLGTVPYRWSTEPDGHTAARLVKVTFDQVVSIIVLEGPMVHAGGLSGGAKALAAKEQLGIDPGVPFMAALGERRQLCMARETENEWELIIPHALLPHLSMREVGLAHFMRHPDLQMPVTLRWQPESGEDQSMRRYDGTLPEDAVALIPNLWEPTSTMSLFETW